MKWNTCERVKRYHEHFKISRSEQIVQDEFLPIFFLVLNDIGNVVQLSNKTEQQINVGLAKKWVKKIWNKNLIVNIRGNVVTFFDERFFATIYECPS
jgi:hypothetical protein